MCFTPTPSSDKKFNSFIICNTTSKNNTSKIYSLFTQRNATCDLIERSCDLIEMKFTQSQSDATTPACAYNSKWNFYVARASLNLNVRVV